MKKIIVIIISAILFCSCSLASPNSSGEKSSVAEIFAMDTYMKLTAYGESGEKALAEAENYIYRLDSLWSVTNKNSEIYALNSGEAIAPAAETAEIIDYAINMNKVTGGAFDISLYPLVKLWGFTTGGAFTVPKAFEIEKALGQTGCEKISISAGKIELEEGSAIDLGGIAKGYLSDRIGEIFEENGVESAIIELGGNVYAKGAKPDGAMWKVGIQNPFNSSSIAGSVKVSDKAVITSGSYERFFTADEKRYHHILDPENGYPAENGLVSVTIISESGAEADCLSTALFVMGLERSAEFLESGQTNANAIFIDNERNIYITKGLENIFEPSDESFSLHILN
ncbi:FAD:protein FMN transferase [Tyzzerella sp. OttesenSCG-928-J15]|nr:FAD:protein FMN transferase [Tyzzerella sp. OttesenSCG-928-J15]